MAKNKNSVQTDSSDKKMQSVVAKNQELENQLKRALADYHNLEKRIDQERMLLGQLSSAILIEKFLPVLDNLENAQKHLNDEGLEIVLKQFRNVLSEEGVEEIPAEGAQFDPKFHEAVEVQEGEKDNMVAKVLTKGYKIEDRVIRPAKVVVEKLKVQKKDQENQAGVQLPENEGELRNE